MTLPYQLQPAHSLLASNAERACLMVHKVPNLTREDGPAPPESFPPHDDHPENSRVFAHGDGF